MNAVAGLSRFRCANLHLWGQLQTEAEADLATSSTDEEGKSGIERPSGGNPVMKLDGVTKAVQGQWVKQASWLLIPCSRYNGQTASNSLTCYHRTGHCYLSLWSNRVGDFWKVHKGEWGSAFLQRDWLTSFGTRLLQRDSWSSTQQSSPFPNQCWEHAGTKHGRLGARWCRPISKG